MVRQTLLLTAVLHLLRSEERSYMEPARLIVALLVLSATAPPYVSVNLLYWHVLTSRVIGWVRPPSTP